MKTKIFALFILGASVFLNSCSSEDDAPVPPVATATPTAQTINTGSATAIALTSSITGTTFSWTVVQAGVTGATSGSGSSIAQTLSTTGAVSGTATYSITPTAEGATGNVVSVVITVKPAIVVTLVNYTAHIKPLLTNSCKPCHVSGGPNPKWDNYATAKERITGIIDRVQREPNAVGFMPQGGAKLSAENIALLKKWVTDGLLEN